MTKHVVAERVALFGPASALTGVVNYRGELAQKGYQLNRFLLDISQHQNRQAYLDDEEAAMERAQLTAHERHLLRTRDYNAMLAYGVNIYALAKAGYVFGNTLMEIGAVMQSAPSQSQTGVV